MKKSERKKREERAKQKANLRELAEAGASVTLGWTIRDAYALGYRHGKADAKKKGEAAKP